MTNAEHLQELLDSIEEKEKELRQFLKAIKQHSSNEKGQELSLTSLIYSCKHKLNTWSILNEPFNGT